VRGGSFDHITYSTWGEINKVKAGEGDIKELIGQFGRDEGTEGGKKLSLIKSPQHVFYFGM